MNLGSSEPLKGTDERNHSPMEAIWNDNSRIILASGLWSTCSLGSSFHDPSVTQHKALGLWPLPSLCDFDVCGGVLSVKLQGSLTPRCLRCLMKEHHSLQPCLNSDLKLGCSRARHFVGSEHAYEALPNGCLNPWPPVTCDIIKFFPAGTAHWSQYQKCVFCFFFFWLVGYTSDLS